MTWAIAFAAVYIYGAGVFLPICAIHLATTRFWDRWTIMGIALVSSLAWPVLAIGWLVADYE